MTKNITITFTDQGGISITTTDGVAIREMKASIKMIEALVEAQPRAIVPTPDTMMKA
jgi:hypothetical protein